MLDAALDDSSRLGPGWQDRGPPVLQQLADTEFDVDSFILSLAKDIIPDASQARLSEGRGKPERKHDFEKDGAAHHQLQGLIDRLEGALEQVLKLREDVSRRWESLEQEVQKEQKSFQGMVGRLEASHVRNAKQHFSELNDRMLEVASRATRIGDRLQVASYMQAQAREAERLLKALWQFSLLDLSDETFRGLPAEYRSDQAIAKTAALVQKLAALTDEAIQAKKQNILATKPLEGPMHSSHSKARYGTIEQAAHGLRRYSDRMVRGVVERFERAAGQSGRRDVGALRACAQDMACLGKQKYLVQSYLASRPLFLETDSWLLSRGGAAFEASAAEHILANLATLFRKLQAAVKEEVALFQKVFDEADKAIAELLQRVFEQKVLCALQEALTLPSPDAPADELHAYLQMVIDIHARTLAFARQIAHNLKARAHAEAAGKLGCCEQTCMRLQRCCGCGRPRMSRTQLRFRVSAAKLKRCSRPAPAEPLPPTAPGLRLTTPPIKADLRASGKRLWPHSIASAVPVPCCCGACLPWCCRPSRARGLPAQAEIGIQEHVDELALLVQKHYMSAELLWLQRKHEEKWRPGAGAAGGEGEAAGAAKVAGGSVLSLELVQDLLDWHAQAVARCVKLAKPGQVAHPVRRLWYCPEDDGGHDGRLLEQLGMHVMASMELLLARLSGSSPVGMSTKGSGRLRRSDIAAASQTIVTASFGMVLDTCKAATQAMKLLQSHFLANVKPHLPGSGSELQSCTLGLVCLVSFTRQQLQKALQTAVARFMLQVEQLLLAEQQRSDFRVTMQDEASQFEEPTPACLLVCGLVSTLQQQAQHALSAGNAQSVLAEVGGSLCVLLKVHMQRYTYTLLGALQWKRDISEYSDTVSPFGVPAVTDSINNLQQVANLLVVGADNLLGLVDSGLRMEHSEALTYISLREDYRTAKVEGRTLQSLFS